MNREDIRRRLSARFGDHGSWSVSEVHRNETPAGTDRVYRAVSARRRLAVKCNQRVEKNEREYEALQKMHGLGVDCARPIWMADDRRFYVMDWLPGADLRRQMLSDDRLELIAAAGRWLRAYHRKTVSKLLWRDPAMLGPVLPGERGAAALAVSRLIETRRQMLRIHRGRIALLHTDFQLQNLARSQGRIFAFDPVSSRIGHVYFDVARFLIGAELHRHVDAWGGRHWPDDAARDRQVFLAAYGGIPRLWAGQFALIEDLQLARLWNNFRGRDNLDAGGALRLRIIEGMMERRGLLPPLPPQDRTRAASR